MDKEVYSPRSLNRLLGLIGAIAKSDQGLSLAQLSVELEAPKSSLLLLLRPLVSMGYLTHSAARYSLGAAMFKLAADVTSVHSFPKLIRPYMQELADRTRESVFLATLDREAQTVTYVESIESQQAVRYSVPAGTARLLYPSAAGRVLLAFQNPDWLAKYLKAVKLVPVTSRTVTDRAALKREIEAIRKAGVAVTEGEAVEGAAGIAAPVFEAGGDVTHALLIGAPAARFRSALPALRAAILDVTGKASGVLRGTAGGK